MFRKNPISHLPKKSNSSFFYQEFLRLDHRLRKNIIIVSFLVMAIGATGIFIGMRKVYFVGERLISQSLSSDQKVKNL